jgi:hypothetical protein
MITRFSASSRHHIMVMAHGGERLYAQIFDGNILV